MRFADYLQKKIGVWARFLMQRQSTKDDFPPVPSLEQKQAIINIHESLLITLSARINDDRMLPSSDSDKVLLVKTKELESMDDTRLDWVHDRFIRWNIPRFLYDFNSPPDDRYNQILLSFFVRTFEHLLTTDLFGITAMEAYNNLGHNRYTLLMAQTTKHLEMLTKMRKLALKKALEGVDQTEQQVINQSTKQSRKRAVNKTISTCADQYRSRFDAWIISDFLTETEKGSSRKLFLTS